MMKRIRLSRAQALGGTALIALFVSADAQAQAAFRFDIKPQALAPALRDFALQSHMTIVADEAVTKGKVSVGYSAVGDPDAAMRELLRGTGLVSRRQGKVFFIGTDKVAAVAPPQSQEPEAVPGDIVVTAQKRSERIQDVPIAISAFTQETLDKQKIEGGPDLLKAVPNLTFSKSNFAGYNLEIRGIGTKAISVTPPVALRP